LRSGRFNIQLSANSCALFGLALDCG